MAENQGIVRLLAVDRKQEVPDAAVGLVVLVELALRHYDLEVVDQAVRFSNQPLCLRPRTHSIRDQPPKLFSTLDADARVVEVDTDHSHPVWIKIRVQDGDLEIVFSVVQEELFVGRGREWSP